MATPADSHLWTICTGFYFPRRLSIRSQKTRDRYRFAVNALGRAIGRDPTKHDLTDDNLTLMASSLLADGLSPATVNEKLSKLRTLQTWLAKRGIVKKFPSLELLPAPDPVPVAWHWDEMRRLFCACRQEQGSIGGIPAGDWWFAWLNWLWNTSERYGASIALRWDMINLETAVASLPASIRKGRKKPAVYPLWPETVAALRAIIEPRRELVFPWPFCEGTYWYRYGRILKRADLPSGRKRKTQAMRVSHATWRKFVGHDPTRALLHSDPATTRKHYLDQTFEAHDQPRLPSPWMDEEPGRG